MRSKTVQKILDSITDEDIARWKQQQIDYKKSLTLEYQLGTYIGEYIVDHYLPTLPTDGILTRHVIEISEEDKARNEELSQKWFELSYDKNEESKAAWKEYSDHNKYLENKYLPQTLECYLPLALNVENIEEFKRGMIDTLWNCDACSYSLKPEDISIVEDQDLGSCRIELKLKTNTE